MSEMFQPFANSNKLGLPLAAPSSQSIIPVMIGNNGDRDADGNLVQSEGNGLVVGWFSIATFTGAETSFSTPDGPLPIISVTRNYPDNEGSDSWHVEQFMAAVFPTYPLDARPWLGFGGFISADDSQYAMMWFMPTQGQGYRLNKGPLIRDLTIRMDVAGGAAPAPLPGPTVTPATQYWACALTQNDLDVNCGYFDINWVELFKVQTSYPNKPVRIEVVSNPAGGEFKSTIVPYPVVAPSGGIEFNTVRILKLKPVVAGNYAFNYRVIDDAGVATPVVLTLTVQ
jgi:hypothetical protein